MNREEKEKEKEIKRDMQGLKRLLGAMWNKNTSTALIPMTTKDGKKGKLKIRFLSFEEDEVKTT